VLWALGGSGCTGDESIDGFSEAEWEKIARMALREAPAPSPTNSYADNPAAAALGQRLWFETRFSGPLVFDMPAQNGGLGQVGEVGKVSCESCHTATEYFYDTRSIPNDVSFGAYKAKRNSPSMVNAIYYKWGGWGGAQDQFWKQGANVSESKDLNGDRLRLAHVIYTYYRDDYNAIFPIPVDASLEDTGRFPPSGMPKAKPTDPDGVWEAMAPEDQLIVNTISANVGKAFEAYERLLVSHNAPIDRYVDGDFDALSSAAKRGLKLFIGKAACEACHKDSTFTDNDFHNTAVAQASEPYDNGRFDDVGRLINPFNGAGVFSDDPAAGQEKIAGIVQTESMRGQFRTKSLRHVAKTAPYFHNGSAATLEGVVRFYNEGGASTGYPGVKDPLMVPLNLTDREVLDLVAFLKALTGHPVPEYLTVNTAAP
jgi:cytochrome c peroxidase